MSNLPDHIPELSQLLLVRRVKSILRLRINQNAILELTPPKDDGRLHMRVLDQDGLCETSVQINETPGTIVPHGCRA